MEVKCLQCDKTFDKKPKDVKRSPNHFCSRSCSATYTNKLKPRRAKTKTCRKCQVEILSYRTFCDDCLKTRKCQTSKEATCKSCNKKGISGRDYCRDCYFKVVKTNAQIEIVSDDNGNIRKRYHHSNCGVCNKPCSGKLCRPCKDEITSNYTLGEVVYKKHHRSSAYAFIRTQARSIIKKLGWNTCKNCGYNKHVEAAHIKAVSSFEDSVLVKDINHKNNLVPLCPNCHWEFDNDLLKL